MTSTRYRSAVLLALGLAGCHSNGGSPYTGNGVPVAVTTGPPPPHPTHYEDLGPVYDRYTLAATDNFSIDGMPTTRPKDFHPLGRVVYRLTTPPGHTVVDVQHAVIGPVAAIDPDRGWLEVLGQDVYVLDQTWSNEPRPATVGPDLGALRVGDRVAVSGNFTADGDVYATHLSRAEPGALLVRGVLAAGSGGRFRIGALEVDLGSATLDGFPASAPLAGDTVLLTAAGPWAGGPLAVSTARLTGGVWKVDATRTEHKTLVGFITAARSATDFDVAGYRIDLDTCGCESLSATPAVGTPVVIERQPLDPPRAVTLNPFTWRTDIVIGPIESIDLAKRTVRVLGTTAEILPATYVVNAEVAGWELPAPLENLLMPLWPRGALSDFAVGDRVAVIGGARDEHFVAGGLLRVAGAYGPTISTSRRIIGAGTLRFYGQEVLSDTQTRVSDCTHGSCQPLTLTSFFNRAAGQYFPPILDLVLDSATPPLRAQSIRVRWQD